MRIAIGADHAGFALKQEVKQLLLELGHEVEDVGTDSDESVDYPDFARAVGERVGRGEAERGVLVCGTGIGMAMAANKLAGVRAAPATDLESARLSREHNDANILALGARTTPADIARALVRTFLDTPFAGGRHQRRVDKITAFERGA